MRNSLQTWLLLASSSAFTTAASAQAIGSNQVYIGQTGDTNTITVDQQGADNLVGEELGVLRLNQFGDLNTITIDQFGFDNEVGALLVSPFPEFRVYGPNQEGNRNRLTVDQSNLNPDSRNSIGAVVQISGEGRATIANDIDVTQETGASSSGQTIEQIVQINTGSAMANSFVVLQTDEGDFGGNAIGRIWQRGDANTVDIQQLAGGNEVRTVTQYGTGNDLTVRQNATGNFVDIVEQNNAVTGGAGNRALLTFFSEGNGVVGVSGISDFAQGFEAARQPGQAQVQQLGDGNTLAFTVSGGPENLYGFFQEGDANGITAVAVGIVNQIAISQFGDGNQMSSQQTGDGNIATVLQQGDDTLLNLVQTGDANRSRVFVTGSRVNGAGLSFDEPLPSAALALPGFAAVPGSVRQIGSDNEIEFDVLGDNHVFAVISQGSGNQVTGIMSGFGNQALINQTGDDNLAGFTQSGVANLLLIVQ